MDEKIPDREDMAAFEHSLAFVNFYVHVACLTRTDRLSLWLP